MRCAVQKSKVCLASALINDRVRNSAGEDLGKIEDVVIDPVTGAIQYAVLSFGGFLGVGDKSFAVPWPALHISPDRDYVLLNVDKKTLERAPGFDRRQCPDMADPVWRDEIHRYYGTASASAPAIDRPVYAGRPAAPVPSRHRISALAVVALICLFLGLVWVTSLVTTRGWDQAREDIRSTFQGAAYAMKESSQDAALTAKVKTALSLSKRIPASQINVDSEGDVVTLRGEVTSDETRILAENIARDTPGVREVRNHLFVVSGTQ